MKQIYPFTFEIYVADRDDAIKHTIRFLREIDMPLLREKAKNLAENGFFWEIDDTTIAFIPPRAILEIHWNWNYKASNEGRTDS